MSGTGQDTAPAPSPDEEPPRSGGSPERQDNDGTQGTGRQPLFPDGERKNFLSRISPRRNQGRQRGTLGADDGAGARNPLQDAHRERREALAPLFYRLLESGLVNGESWLKEIWEEANDPPQWQPVDVERCVNEIGEQLQAFLGEQDDDLVLDFAARNRTVAQARRELAHVRDVAADSVARHVAEDAASLRRVADRLVELLPAPPPQPETTKNPGRRMSAASELDVVVDRDNPEKLAKLSKKELIDYIKAQQIYHKETLAEMNDAIEQYEGEIDNLKTTETNLTRRVDDVVRDAKKSQALYVEELERVAEVAYHNGRHNLLINGSGPAPPLTDEDEKNYQANLGQQGNDALIPTTPIGRKGLSNLETPPRDEFEEDKRQYYDDVQELFAKIDEDKAFSERYIAQLREGVHREALDRVLAGLAPRGEAAPQLSDTSPSRRTSVTASSASSREQLQTLLRITEEERDDARKERDRYRAEVAIRSVDELDNLSPANRQRVADICEKSLKLINHVIRILPRISRQNYDFANTMVHVARMGEGGGIKEALQRVALLQARIISVEPRVYNPDIFEVYGQFEAVEEFQEKWVLDVDAFLNTFNKQYDGLEVLRQLAREWDAGKPQDEQGQLLGSPQGGDSRRQSISGGSNNQGLLSRAASSLSGLIFGGGEQNQPDDQGPLYTDPNWALWHADGPCPWCEEVLRFPIVDDQDGRAPGLCTCGDGEMVEPRSAETTRSSHSGVSRVSFADAASPPASASNVSSPRSTKSILRRGPARLDIELANAEVGSDVWTRPRTPHPSKAWSEAGYERYEASGRWRRCACSCRVGGRQNVLTAGDGRRFAYYTCKRVSLRSDPAPSSHPESSSPIDPFDDTVLSGSIEDIFTSPELAHTALSKASQSTQTSRSPSTAPSGASPLQHSPKDIPLPPERGFSAPSTVLSTGLRRHSDPPSRGLQPMPQQLSTQSERPPAVSRPGEAQVSPGGEPPRGGDGVPETRRPQTPEPEPKHEHPGPLQELWSSVQRFVFFLTWGQVCNAWRIGQYLLGLVYYYAGRHYLDRYRKLRGQPASHLWTPVVPIDQIRQLVLWLMIVWFSVTMIALQEERRIWLAANPRTGSYMRGLRYRDPYPSWSPFQVDYSLLEPAFDRLSVRVHRAVFRPGLAVLFGLDHNQPDGAVENATGLA